MNMATSTILAVNTLRLAHDFLAAFTIDPASAIAHLRVNIDSLDEWEFRQWIDYLGALLVEEESTPDVWRAMFTALEAID